MLCDECTDFSITLFCIGIEKLKFKIQKFRSSVRVFRVHLKKEIKFSDEFIDTVISEKSDDMKYIVVRKNEELACSIKNRYRISATGEATVGTAAVCRIK